MEPVHPLVQAYAERFTTPEDGVLKRIADDTYQNHADPRMLSGHLQGKFLQFISRLIKPFRVLEIGTFTGYSAICLSAGLKPGGMVHTIELRKEDAELSRRNFELAGVDDRIISHTGNALDIIQRLNETWDLVFIDADKPAYISYYQMIMPALRPGGVILADNVLFHGEVLEDTIKGKNALAIHAFNEHVQNDESVEQVLLTIRDGLLLITKK